MSRNLRRALLILIVLVALLALGIDLGKATATG
jgi:hypothetical protein